MATGIAILKQPMSEVDAGNFNLPVKFDRKKHAAQWKQKGVEVDKAMGLQTVLGTRLTATGWEVYKEDGKPVMRASGKNEYVLMFRPREVQDAVNALYGNVGKERMLTHKKGETSAGVPLEQGMIPERVLSEAMREPNLEEDGAVIMNKVVLDDVPVEAATLQVPKK